ncbi:MAG: hypothetical protein KGZ96_03170 [Clostridia bacterium]|nr:hypothetical protein [Clostridia bacterium]
MSKRGLLVLAIIVLIAMVLSSCGENSTQGDETPAIEKTQPQDVLSVGEELSKDKKRDEILSNYSFYQGVATVMEDQSWESRGTDGSHGEGDAVLTSDEYLVYDETTKIMYILARNLTYRSSHIVTVNDLNGYYLNTANVSAKGELAEYYYLGIVYDGKNVSFSGLPVRFDVNSLMVYTRPATKNTLWVEYTSTADTVRLGSDRVMPPDISTNETLQQLPNLDHISDEKTYGNKETRVYEATTRLWNLKGRFDYTYKKITLEDMLQGVKAISDSELNNDTFSKMVEPLPEVWKETTKYVDMLDNVMVASAGMSTILNGVDDLENSVEGKDVDIIDIIRNQEEFNELKDELKTQLANQREDSTKRSLEGFVLDQEDENLKESFLPFTETIDVLLLRFKDYSSKIDESINLMNQENMDVNLETLHLYVEKTKVESEGLLELFELTREKITRALVEDPLIRLDEFYREWPIVFYSMEGRKSQVDMENGVQLPLGYPKDIVSIINESSVVMTDVIPSTGDDKEGYMVTIKVDKEEIEIVNYYEEVLKKYQEYNRISMAGMTILNANKDDYYITVMISKNSFGGEEEFMVQITIVDEEN